ncbi:MAG TPA: hypothetical protein VD833_25010 [Vicinamibacterales bacterium]|nr:hypothetical protein [Vicinamibacterales bacterium]
MPWLEQLRYDPAFTMAARRIARVCAGLLVSAMIVLVVSSCSRREEAAPPVATPSLSLGRDRAAIGSPLTFTYKFTASQEISGDYWVFVHVLEPDGERLWGDDHQPPVPTSAWKPGQTIEYTRTVFVPNYPYIGPAEVRLGLYQPGNGQRLTLDAKEIARREYLVAQLQILPQSENVFLIYKEGWHPAEVSPDDPSIEWQWTRKSAVTSFPNPKQDATIYVEYDARTDLFTPPQQVTLRIGDQVIGTFAADSSDKKLLTLPVTAAQFGSGDVVELVLEVDRTFTPGGGDTRDLGIRVFHLFVEPR